jgi:hypothetical protein
MVLYGIAMADWAQQSAGTALTRTTDRQKGKPHPQQQEQQEQQPQQQLSGSTPAFSPTVGARAGCASLALYTNSLGRFGAPGAFMVPSYGAGRPNGFYNFEAGFDSIEAGK